MKQLLTALLIVLVFGCKEKEKPYEIRKTFIFGTDTLDMDSYGEVNGDKWHTGHFNGNGHNDTINRVFYDTFRVQCHDTVFIHDTVYTSKHYGNVKTVIIGPQPSPLPDTTKPIKVKMQPRWRDDTIYVQSIPYNHNDSLLGMRKTEPDIGWLTKDQYDSFMRKIDTTLIYEGTDIDVDWQPQDTTKCLLLVSDTSSINGFRSSRCWWMEGYVVEDKYNLYESVECLDKNGEPIRCPKDWFFQYLDQFKIPLKKNIIVWLSKELK